MRKARLVSSIVIAAGLAGSLAGCNTSSLTKRELVVEFTDTTSNATRIADRAQCLHVNPEVTPEPLPTNDKFVTDTVNDVRYRIDHANDRELAQLEDCFSGKTGVTGFDDQSGEDDD